MRLRENGIVLGAVALAALVFGSVALGNDDVAVFNLQDPTLVGTVTLEPGSYTFRAVHVSQTAPFMVVYVTNAAETTTYALVRARTEPLGEATAATVDTLDMDIVGGARKVTSWQLPDKHVRYVFEQ